MFTTESANDTTIEAPTAVWEGLVSGKHWIARIVNVDPQRRFCCLSVVTGDERDAPVRHANCMWDYEFDHFLNRFGVNSPVPANVTSAMRNALRAWAASNLRMDSRAA